MPKESISSNKVWTDRALNHISVVTNSWKSLGYPGKLLQESQFRSFGSYPGLVYMAKQLERHDPEASDRLKDYIGDLPGIMNKDDFFDLEKNDIFIATREIDFLIPMCLEILKDPKPYF